MFPVGPHYVQTNNDTLWQYVNRMTPSHQAPPPPPPRPLSLAHAMTLLFSAHAVGLIVPLLTIPWLARVLGPTGWAPVLVAQALAGWAILVLEFGFDLVGTRDVAQAESSHAMAHTAASVQLARILLTPVVACGVILAGTLVGHEPRLVAGTVVLVVARGLSPYWFFQGKQRIHMAVLVDTLGKLVPAAAMFVWVRETGDGWRVVALQAVGAGLVTIILTWRVHQQHILPAVTVREAVAALRSAVPMFAVRATSGVYIQANTLILSLVAPPVAVATYGGVERIVRAAINLFTPLTQAYFPRISQLARVSPVQALTEIRRTLVLLVSGSFAGALVLALLGNTVIALLLGSGYPASVSVLRVLILALPLVAVSTVLGIYWALPWRRERLFLGAVLLGGGADVALAVLLAPRLHAIGMATAVIGAEFCVSAVLAVTFLRSTRVPR